MQLLSFTAQRIAEEARALTAQRRLLLGYDRMLVGSMLPMAMVVRTVLGEITVQDTSRADAGPWRRAMEALRADPQAVVEIELPAPVVPSLPVPFHAQGPLVRMTPIRRPVVPQLPSAPDDGDPALPDPPQ